MVVELETDRWKARRKPPAVSLKVNIPGFRRGKAYEIVRHVATGQPLLTEEEAVSEIWSMKFTFNARTGRSETAAPRVRSKTSSLERRNSSSTYRWFPTVGLGDYRHPPAHTNGLRRLRAEAKEIQQLRQIHATSQTVERPARGGYVLVAVMSSKPKPSKVRTPLRRRPAYAV